MYNTGNAVPSDKLEDVSDNAQVFDALVTKTEGTTTDRLGRTRRVFQQILMDMGFQPLSGSFQTGATITARNQCLVDASTGIFYSWDGSLPKVVPVGSKPSTAGGVGALLWVDRTDIILRANLAASTGAGLVGTTDGITVQAKLNAIAADKANTSDVNAALALKANKSDVNAALALKANTSDLATKADTATVISRTKKGGLTTAVAGGAMTLTQAKRLFSFRSGTLTIGDTVEVTPAYDLTLTIPSGATLGTSSGKLANLIPVILYNSGNPVLGVVNLAGGLDLSEAGLLSATAISASSNSVSVAYASVAVTNSPYIVAGIVQSTQATAGTWATAPAVIPKSTNFATMIGGLGYGQAWQNLTASRTCGTTYYNTTGKPIYVAIQAASATAEASSSSINCYVDGVMVTANATSESNGKTWLASAKSFSFIVPPGSSYSAARTNTTTLVGWSELR